MTTKRPNRGTFRDDYELWLCKIARELVARDRAVLWQVAEALWRSAQDRRAPAQGAA
jgi:hypothetical protein